VVCDSVESHLTIPTTGDAVLYSSQWSLRIYYSCITVDSTVTHSIVCQYEIGPILLPNNRLLDNSLSELLKHYDTSQYVIILSL